MVRFKGTIYMIAWAIHPKVGDELGLLKPPSLRF